MGEQHLRLFYRIRIYRSNAKTVLFMVYFLICAPFTGESQPQLISSVLKIAFLIIMLTLNLFSNHRTEKGRHRRLRCLKKSMLIREITEKKLPADRQILN